MIFDIIDQYKAKIDESRPFEGNMLKQLRDYYRIDLTWSSNALEGNTLTESETKILLEDGLTAGGKPLRYTFEALGHAKAYDFMFTLLNKAGISEDDILLMHEMFYHDIDENNAGKYREDPVFITGSKYPVCEPERIQEEMGGFIEWADLNIDNYHSVEYAALLHKRFVFIHPFIDGNGRLSRLIMNTALIQRGYLLAIIPPILRQEYISLLELSHKNDKPFVEFIAQRVLETEKEIMRLMHLKL